MDARIEGVSRSLFSFVLILQAMLLAGIATVAAGPARAADDCSSFSSEACLREAISSNGTARTLSVNILRQNQIEDYFNVTTPGGPQIRVEPGGTFTLAVPSDGKVVYSIQACDRGTVTQTFCTPWKQIVRSFGGDGSACTKQGLGYAGGDQCTCPMGYVNTSTGLPGATEKNQCVTAKDYNLAHACQVAGLSPVPGSSQCLCPTGFVNTATGLPGATNKSQCVTAQAYNAAHPTGSAGGGGGSQTATAPNGTTIYKQPNGDDSKANIAGYVDPGGKVTVVSCDGNFCNISAPTAGWVWHADIGR